MKWAKAVALSAPFLLGAGPATLLGSTLLAAPAAQAAEEKLGAKVGKPLQEAQALAQKGALKEAMVKVREAAAVEPKSPYEAKVVNEFTAFVAMKQSDYATAAKAYEATLDSPLLTREEREQRLSGLTKLYYQLKQYDKVERFANRYQKEIGYDADTALLLGQSQYLRQDYASAERTIGELIKRSAAPKEDWLKLRMSCLHQLQRRDEVMAVLEELLTRYPSPAYWRDALAYAQASAGSSDRAQLEIYRLKREVGALEADEYLEMAELGLALGQYGEALAVLESGFQAGLLGKDNGGRDQRLLALAKSQAQEDRASLAELEKEAAADSSGEIAVKVGEAYLNYGDYAKAEQTIGSGLAKGGVKSVAEAQLHRGIALQELQRKQEAVQAFQAVPADSALGRVARLWTIEAGRSG